LRKLISINTKRVNVLYRIILLSKEKVNMLIKFKSWLRKRILFYKFKKAMKVIYRLQRRIQERIWIKRFGG